MALPEPSAERPRVLVSLGSVFAQPDTLRAVIAELTSDGNALDAELIVTRRMIDGGSLIDAPENVAVVPFQPMARQIVGADAALVHGGAGTVIGALCEGVPLVVLPLGADQFVQAAAVGKAGGGIALPIRPGHLGDHADCPVAVLGQLLYIHDYRRKHPCLTRGRETADVQPNVSTMSTNGQASPETSHWPSAICGSRTWTSRSAMGRPAGRRCWSWCPATRA
ncbi:glycosyltransferase [Streptomyces acidicola]|uniref:glycosyltransferase n=1 Tax=Streptomyces acidicola TaxID=2596892 RepID=UPI00379082A0